MISMGYKQVHEYGLSHHLASVRAINIPVLELLNDLDLTFNKLQKTWENKSLKKTELTVFYLDA